MIAIIVALFVMLALCGAVAAVVLMGMEGRGHRRAPKIARTMTKAARHLNGDAQPPRAFRRLLEHIPAFR